MESSSGKTIVVKPTYKQHLAYESMKTFDETFFGGGAGSGKSWLICESRFLKAIQYPGYKSFIGREELKRLMGSTYLTFIKVSKFHGVPPNTLWKLNGQYNYIEFTNGSRIDLLDLKFLPSDPLYERFGSMEYTDGAIEEAGEVDFRAYDVLKSRIGRHMNEELGLKPTLLITGNPKKNWTYRVFYLPWKKGLLSENRNFINSRYVDNPYTAATYGKSLSQIEDSVTRSRLMDGNWEYDEDKTALLTYDEIVSIFYNEGIPGNKFITIDPAFGGKDECVMYYWNGYIVEKQQNYPIVDHDNLIQLVDLYARENNVPKRNILTDAGGEGAYIPKFLRGVRAFLGNASPLKDERAFYDEAKKPNFSNLRSQCIWEFAQTIKQGKVAFKIKDSAIQEKIVEEMQQWKMKSIDDDVKLAIISKEEIRENIGRSTDYSDALYERAYFDLMSDAPAHVPTDYEIHKAAQEEIDEFDPYSVI